MNVVDSSAWLEYLAGGPNASVFAQPIEDVEQLLVPVIVLYEVFKKILSDCGEDQALSVAAAMQQGQVVDADPMLAVSAAKLSVALRLPMADSLILAAAHSHEATLWTQDADFKGLPKVRFVAKVVKH